MIAPDERRRFILENTALQAPPHTPELRLHLASEVMPIWRMTEEALCEIGLPPPFWAFAWAGGQALARYLLDHRESVAGQAVLDFGAGSGLVAIAAMKAGAQEATAAEIDGFAAAAIALNATLNDVAVMVETADVIGRATAAWQTILVGDLCYERLLAARLTEWLRALARNGTTILLGDPGRTYLPKSGLRAIARYTVPTPLDLEDRTTREGVVWRLEP